MSNAIPSRFALLEFSTRSKLPPDSFAPCLELSDIDNLCQVNKHFKWRLSRVGTLLAYNLHKVALSALLSINKINDLERRNKQYANSWAVNSIHEETLQGFYEKNKSNMTPLGLYKYLIKNTKYSPFYEQFAAFNIKEPFSLDYTKTPIIWKEMVFNVYSQLRQANVYMPTTCVLAVRLAKEARWGDKSKEGQRVCQEVMREWWYDSNNDELLEFVIKIAEQIPCPEKRGFTQAVLAKSCVEKGKMEIAQKLLGDIQACEDCYDLLSVGNSLIKHAISLKDKDQIAKIVASVVSCLKSALGSLQQQLKKKYPFDDPLKKPDDRLYIYLDPIINRLLELNFVQEAAALAKFNVSTAKERDERIDKCSLALGQNKEWIDAFKLTSEISDDTTLNYCWDRLLIQFKESPEGTEPTLCQEIINLIIQERSKEKRSKILSGSSIFLLHLLRVLPDSVSLKIAKTKPFRNLGDDTLNSWVQDLEEKAEREKRTALNTDVLEDLRVETPQVPVVPPSRIPISSPIVVEEPRTQISIAITGDPVANPIVVATQKKPVTTEPVSLATPPNEALSESTVKKIDEPLNSGVVATDESVTNQTPPSSPPEPVEQTSGGIASYFRACFAAFCALFTHFFTWIRELCSRSSNTV
jgi:hypothetical protein